MDIKALLVGTGKAWFYMVALVITLWVFCGFETPIQTDITGVLAAGAIVRHFVDREQDKQSK